jgi:hypothetical protein
MILVAKIVLLYVSTIVRQYPMLSELYPKDIPDRIRYMLEHNS